uniref:Uncharacterized protein n=1 Tax=Meloidogyne enterolobii TaxID=390850 RepID=A0A6V7XYH1_MELEN|nr:unnamed protein product [Meloidogyne enterolobii]
MSNFRLRFVSSPFVSAPFVSSPFCFVPLNKTFVSSQCTKLLFRPLEQKFCFVPLSY